MNIFQEAVEHHGKDNQLKKLQEECMELALAIHQYRQGKVLVDCVLEEMADVHIMLAQMDHVFGVDHQADWYGKKLKRLKDRIAAGKHKEAIMGGD